MISDDMSTSQGFAGWLKWLIGTGFALIAAGGSIVAILEYLEPDPHPAPASNPVSVAPATPVTVVPATSVPSPVPEGVSPELWQAVEDFLSYAIVAEITAYEYGDPSYATMFYAGAMETLQSQISDLNARGLLLMAYFDYDNSYIHNIRALQNSRIEVDTCEYWAHDYYDRQSGAFLDSDPWELVPQTITIEELNANFYITSVAFYAGQAFCQ